MFEQGNYASCVTSWFWVWLVAGFTMSFKFQFRDKREICSAVHRQNRDWFCSSQTKESLVLQFTDKRESGIAVHRQKRDWYCSSQTKERLVLQFTDKRESGIAVHRQKRDWYCSSQTKESGIAVHRQKRVREYDIWLLWIVEIISMCPSWPTHNDTAF